MVSIRLISALLGMTLLASCEAVELLGSLPVITADPIEFRSSSQTKRLTARITRSGARMAETGLTVTCEVSLRLAPNRATDPVTITAVQGEGTRWACTLPAGFTIRTNQVLQSQWMVHSGTTPLADSGRREAMPDCPDPSRAMIDLQTTVQGRFPGGMRHDQIISAGFVPIHGFTSYQGMGVAFVRGRAQDNHLAAAASLAMSSFGPPRLDTPDILLFRPTGNGVTDAGGPDNPYRLIGWGYAETIMGAQLRRPQLSCVPRHQWFIQASGYHNADGTFSPAPGPTALHATGSGFRQRLWYVFLFVNEDGEAPTIGMVKSGGTALPGITAPANSFYYTTADG